MEINKLLKNFTSLIVAVMLCFTAIPAAFANVTEPFVIFAGTVEFSSVNNVAASSGNGAFGASNTATYLKDALSSDDYRGYNVYYSENASWNTLKDYSYLVLSQNFVTDENIQSIYLQTKSSRKVGNTILSSNWNVNRWNNVTFICTVNTAATATDTTNYAITFSSIETYINGVLVDTASSGGSFLPNSKSATVCPIIRIAFDKTQTTNKVDYTTPCDAVIYNGIASIYAINTKPVMPTPPTVNNRMKDEKVLISDKSKVSDITCNKDTSVRVYTDDTFSQQLSPSELIPDSAVIVAQKDEMLAYINVSNVSDLGEDVVLHDDVMFLENSETAACADAFVFGMKNNPSGAVNESTVTEDSCFASLNTELKASRDISDRFDLAMEVNFVPDENFGGLFLKTANDEKVGNIIPAEKFSANRWNNVVFVCEIDNETSIYDTETYSLAVNEIKTYVNGVLADTYSSASAFMTTEIYPTEETPLDIGIGISKKSTADSTKVYTAISHTCASFAYAAPSMPQIENSVENGRIIGFEAMTTADITASDGATVKVFRDNSFEEILDDNEVLTSSSIAVIQKDGRISYYRIKMPKQDITVSTGLASFDGGAALIDGCFGMDRAKQAEKVQSDDAVFAQINPDGADAELFADYSYAVIRAHVAVDEGVESINLQTANGKTVGDAISADKLTPNRWTELLFVCSIDNASTYADGSKLVLNEIKTYINGALKATYSEKTDFDTSGGAALEMLLAFNVQESACVYASDITLSAKNQMSEITQPPTVTNQLINGKIALKEGAKAEDITAQNGAELRIYRDDTFTALLNSTDALTDESIAVVELDGMLSYYTVSLLKANMEIYSGFPLISGIDAETSEMKVGLWGREISSEDKIMKTIQRKDGPDKKNAFRSRASLNSSKKATAAELKDYEYFVMNANFATDSNIASIYMQTASSIKIGNAITADKWKQNAWNNIMFVCKIDSEATANDKTTYGLILSQIYTYINGVIVDSYNSKSILRVSASSASINSPLDIRICFDKTVANGEEYIALEDENLFDSIVYLSKTNLYVTNDEPVQDMPIPSFGEISNDGDAVYMDDDCLAGSLPPNAMVYEYGNFEMLRAAGERISFGDIITVKNDDCVLAYYNVLIRGADYKLFDRTGASFGKSGLNYENSTGLFGKDATDKSSTYVSGSLEQAIEADNTSDYGYFTAEMSFAPTDSTITASLTDDSNTRITKALRTQKWNKLRYIYNIASKKLTIEINGEKADERTLSTDLFDNEIILKLEAGAATAVDNCIAYFSENEPKSDIVPVISEKLSRYENVLYIDGILKSSDVTSANASVRIYQSNDFSKLLNQADILATANVAVLESKDGIFAYYNAVNKEIWGFSGTDAEITVSYNPTDSTINFKGFVPTEKSEQISFRAKSPAFADEIVINPVTNADGSVNYSEVIASKYIGRRYTYTLDTESVRSEGEIIIASTGSVLSFIGQINDATSEQNAASLIFDAGTSFTFDDGNAQKDFSYIGRLLYSMNKDKNYDYNSFLNAYMVAEGMSYVKSGSITFGDFLKNYLPYLNKNYYADYNVLSGEYKEILNRFFKQGKVFSDLSDSISEGLWVCEYQTAATANVLKKQFLDYCSKNSISTKAYTSIENNYNAEKIFEKMFLSKKLCNNIEDAVDTFNASAKELAKNTAVSSGSGGGGGDGGIRSMSVTSHTELQQQATVGFQDVIGHWAENYIKRLASFKIVNGYTDGSFKPDKYVTRAEFSKMITAMLDQNQKGAATFNDVRQDSWYVTSVAVAAQLGIVTGYDGSFFPERVITRQDAATMVYRVLDSVQAVTTSSTENTYSDESEIADYASDKISVLTGMGIIKGDGESFYPQRSLTRAEASAMLTAIIGYLPIGQE